MLKWPPSTFVLEITNRKNVPRRCFKKLFLEVFSSIVIKDFRRIEFSSYINLYLRHTLWAYSLCTKNLETADWQLIICNCSSGDSKDRLWLKMASHRKTCPSAPLIRQKGLQLKRRHICETSEGHLAYSTKSVDETVLSEIASPGCMPRTKRTT